MEAESQPNDRLTRVRVGNVVSFLESIQSK